MPNKRTHNIINFSVLSLPNIFIIIRYLLGKSVVGLPFVATFTICFCISTIMLSPDLDIHIPKKWGPLRFLFVPYRELFYHRGLSHTPFVGTLTRWAYLLIVALVIGKSLLFLAGLAGLTTFSLSLKAIWLLALKYKFYIGIGFLGSVAADILHVTADIISTTIKRTF